jgi:osmotically-inducible protein OsmY
MNRRTRGLLTVAASLTLALLLAGCSTTQTAGRQIDDTSIHAAVSAKLTGERFSNLVNIDINVTNGVVTLAGEVPNAQVKADAQSETAKVSGVVRVINNLQVKSPPVA